MAKAVFTSIAEGMDFNILVMEVDADHIHFLLEYAPTVSGTQIVRFLKQESSWILWNTFPDYLSKQCWREKTFWSDGYFAFSVGKAAAETLAHDIESQG